VYTGRHIPRGVHRVYPGVYTGRYTQGCTLGGDTQGCTLGRIPRVYTRRDTRVYTRCGIPRVYTRCGIPRVYYEHHGGIPRVYYEHHGRYTLGGVCLSCFPFHCWARSSLYQV